MKRPIPSEFQEQKAVIEWWNLHAPTKGIDPRLLFSIPNGSFLAGDAKRRAIQMRKLKETGLRVGTPDLMLAHPVPTWPGMFVEMKRKTGKPSPDQLEMATILRQAGYNVVIAKGADEAIRALKAYVDPFQTRHDAPESLDTAFLQGYAPVMGAKRS